MVKYKIEEKVMEKEKDLLLEDFEDDTCDLDPNKICDSCGKCIEIDKNYKIIKITKIVDSADD